MHNTDDAAASLVKRQSFAYAFEPREDDLKLLFDSIPNAVISTDMDFCITNWNKSAEIVYGWKASEVIGKPSKDVLQTRFLNNIDKKGSITQILNQEYWSGGVIQKHKDGTDIFIMSSVGLIKGDNGQAVGTVAVNTDITGQKKSIKELEAHCQQLEEAMKKQTGELNKRTRYLGREIKHNLKTKEELRAVYARLIVAMEEERQDISRELHDEIGQNLAALNIAVARAVRSLGEKAIPLLGQARELVVEVNSQVHDLLANIKRPIIERAGLLPGLIAHIDCFETFANIKVNFSHAGLEADLPAEISNVVYHVLQEALTNVSQHAGVKDVYVLIRAGRKKLKVLVEDNGKGFNPGALTGYACSGLNMMEENAVAVGGVLNIESSPGKGTRVLFELPLTSEKEKGSGR